MHVIPSAHLLQASFPCPTCYYSIVCLNACPVSLPSTLCTKSIMGIGPLTQVGFQGNMGLGLGSPPTQGHRAKRMESPQ